MIYKPRQQVQLLSGMMHTTLVSSSSQQQCQGASSQCKAEGQENKKLSRTPQGFLLRLHVLNAICISGAHMQVQLHESASVAREQSNGKWPQKQVFRPRRLPLRMCMMCSSSRVGCGSHFGHGQTILPLRTSSSAEVLNWPPWLKKVVLRTEGARTLDLLKVTCRPHSAFADPACMWNWYIRTAAVKALSIMTCTRHLTVQQLRQAQRWVAISTVDGQTSSDREHSRNSRRGRFSVLQPLL